MTFHRKFVHVSVSSVGKFRIDYNVFVLVYGYLMMENIKTVLIMFILTLITNVT